MSELNNNLNPGGANLQVKEELKMLLAYSQELFHTLTCSYLFAAYSLKIDQSEGGLTPEQASMVRGWKRELLDFADSRLDQLIQTANLLAALGITPAFERPDLFSEYPQSGGPAREMTPFSIPTLARFISYEVGELDLKQTAPSASSAPLSETSRRARSSLDVISQLPLKASLARLYQEIELRLNQLSHEEFGGEIRQLRLHAYSSSSTSAEQQLTTITDAASARSALARIFEADGQQEAEGSIATTRLTRLRTILSEFQTAQSGSEPAEAEAGFQPARLAGNNPVLNLPNPEQQPGEFTLLVEPACVEIASLFNKAYDLALAVLGLFYPPESRDEETGEEVARTFQRLLNSVMRPLGEALTRLPAGKLAVPLKNAGPTFSRNDSSYNLAHTGLSWQMLDELIWQLTQEATQAGLQSQMPLELLEAIAALQDLSCSGRAAGDSEARLEKLKQLQAEQATTIRSSVNGPYLATNVFRLKTWLGEELAVRPAMAFCRCGLSVLKPLCDGSHARTDFSGAKDPGRVADRRASYSGTAVRIMDNRGICAHSGFCTDRLPGVFRQGEEPFVVPNGARMDEIIQAVRACPSGALSFALGSVEVRTVVDQEREPAIEVSKDGPYRVTGGITLRDEHGNPEARNEGVSLEHYSLCRCGHSQNKPFCSGMHWYVNFQDPKGPEVTKEVPTIFEWIGGFPALLRMTELFYNKYVPQDPLLEPLFGRMSPDHPQRVAAWLGEVFGGPDKYSEHFGDYNRMLSQHIGKNLSEAQRARWAALMCKAADEVGIPKDPEARSAFVSYIEWGTRLAVENSSEGAHPPKNMPVPHWNWGASGAPGARISALASPNEEPEEEKIMVPAENEVIHFDPYIKSLFRQRDRQSMLWAFDLWSATAVKEQAEEIYKRLKAGTMPCDGAWPAEKLALFARWMQSDMPD